MRKAFISIVQCLFGEVKVEYILDTGAACIGFPRPRILRGRGRLNSPPLSRDFPSPGPIIK